MARKEIDQIKRQIDAAEEILLLTHRNPDGDGLGAILALALILEKMNKRATVVSLDEIPYTYTFLPKSEHIEQDIHAVGDFIISLSCKDAEINKLKYHVEDDQVHIIVTPKKGQFREEDVSFLSPSSKYDLIIVADSPNLGRLGPIYEEQPGLFYDTPIINIDHHADNEYFGQINLVDLAATSSCELALEIIEALDTEKLLIDEDVATCILTGVIYDTGSFQNLNTSPKAFAIAAKLQSLGARQQEIIKHLYKTHSLETLKLWGIMLGKVRINEQSNFIYAKADAEDFKASSSTPDDTEGFIDSFLTSTPNVNFALLLREEPETGAVKGSLRSIKKHVDVRAIAEKFGGGGHTAAAGFRIENTTLPEAEDLVFSKIKEHLATKKRPENLDEAASLIEEKAPKTQEKPAKHRHDSPHTIDRQQPKKKRKRKRNRDKDPRSQSTSDQRPTPPLPPAPDPIKEASGPVSNASESKEKVKDTPAPETAPAKDMSTKDLSAETPSGAKEAAKAEADVLKSNENLKELPMNHPLRQLEKNSQKDT